MPYLWRCQLSHGRLFLSERQALVFAGLSCSRALDERAFLPSRIPERIAHDDRNIARLFGSGIGQGVALVGFAVLLRHPGGGVGIACRSGFGIMDERTFLGVRELRRARLPERILTRVPIALVGDGGTGPDGCFADVRRIRAHPDVGRAFRTDDGVSGKSPGNEFFGLGFFYGAVRSCRGSRLRRNFRSCREFFRFSRFKCRIGG